MIDLNALMDDSEILNVPAKMKPFLSRDRKRDMMQSWGAYAYGFAAAFDELYQVAALAAPRRDYLLPPVAYLARHSIELALKDAIQSLARWNDITVQDHGHGLAKLWVHLLGHVEACGFTTDDDWTRHCSKLVQHLDERDRGSMRFRYPADQAGNLYQPTAVELEGLGKAHHHITRYCDAVVSMIDAAQP